MITENIYQINSLRFTAHRLRIHAEEINLTLLPSGIDYSKDRVDSSPSDKNVDKMCEAADLMNEADRLEGTARALVQIVHQKIDKLSDYRERYILTHFYLMHESTKKIMADLGISERTYYRIKKSGLANYENGS